MLTNRYKNILFIIPLFFMASCQSSDSWNGTYVYEADLGRNVADTPVLVEYTLKIDNGTCRIGVIGYQTDEDIICTRAVKDGSLDVMFKSYGDGKITNIYDVKVYDVGSVLFRLSSDSSGMITIWENLAPDDNVVKSGVYFIKSASD